VFALLGVIADADDLGIEADYSKPCRAIFTKVAEALIQRKGLKILSCCQYSERRQHLPSLVPDWSVPLRRMVQSISHEPKWTPFIASGLSVASFMISHDVGRSRLLSLKGARFDTVHCSGPAFPEGVIDNSESCLALLSVWLAEIKKLSGHSPNIDYSSRQQEQALWRTPIMDFGSDDAGHRFRATSVFHYGYQVLTGAANPPKECLADSIFEYVAAMSSNAKQMRPFVSSRGYLGLGPLLLEPGNLVCIFFGANVPFILRKCQDSRYQLIGETYLHGIMDGEFMEQDPTPEIFELY
jgi:hypothetical protein